jgi:transposase
MLHQGKITSADVIKFFEKIVRRNPKRHVVLIMDKAPPHTSGATLKYISSEKRLHVFNFPSRSPELNPNEKIWNHLKNEELKSHQARNINELRKIVKNKLTKMSKKPALLKGLFYRSFLSKFFK